MSEFESGLNSLYYSYLKRYPKKARLLDKVRAAVRKQRDEGRFPEGVGWEAVEDAFHNEFAGATAKPRPYTKKPGHK